MSRVLVTGGAGFVGGHLVDALVGAGHAVRILDSVEPQAHPDGVPAHLHTDAELARADLRDRDAVGKALEGIEVVFHQGGMVGNGQSMYDIHRYIDVNAGGTAILLEEVLRRRDTVRRVVAASSMVVYGEGAYRCDQHGIVAPGLRSEEQLRRHDWEPRCPQCAAPAAAAATPEQHPLQPTSVYGISKRDCEELVLVTGRAHGVECVALRYLNVYGPRQALSNPYTGVAAIFCTRLLNGAAPTVFEDGHQLRDLVHITDVVRANLLAMDAPGAAGHAINIGTGTSISVLELAAILARELGVPIDPEVTGRYRAGDIRHCWADISLARSLLGYEPHADRAAGLAALAAWVRGQAPIDTTASANRQLEERGLIR